MRNPTSLDSTDKSNFSGTHAFEPTRLLDLLTRHLGVFITFVLTGIISVYIYHSMFPVYKSKAVIALQAAINNPLQSLSARLGGFSGFDVDGREADRYISRLRIYDFFLRAARDVKADPNLAKYDARIFNSQGTINAVIRKFQKRKYRPLDSFSDAQLADRLRGMIIFSKESSEAVSVYTVAANKWLASYLNNLIAETAVKALIDFEVQDLKDSDVYLKLQITTTENAMQETEQAMADFKKSKKILSSGNSALEDPTVRALDIQKELNVLNVAIEQNSREIEQFSEEQGGDINPDYKFGTVKKIAALRRENSDLRVKKVSLEKVLGKLYDSYDVKSEQKVLEFKKRMELNSSLYQELKKHAFQMDMRRISANNKFRIMDRAREAAVQRSESLAAKSLISVVISIILAGLIAYGMEYIFPVVREKRDLDEIGLKVLGNVPDGTRPRKKILYTSINRWRRKSSVMRPGAEAAISMAFVQIRSRLLGIPKKEDSTCQVIAVLSAQDDDGKSFITKNIALSLAHTKKRVLLIDGNLRLPSLTEDYACSGSDGLAETIFQPDLFGQLVKRQGPVAIDFLPAGTIEENEDATEMIASSSFAALIMDLRVFYDFIIIDTPSLDRTPDSLLIAKVSDIPVFVASANETSTQKVVRSVEELHDFHIGPFYAVLNKAMAKQDHVYLMQGKFDRRKDDRRRDGLEANV